MPFDITNFPSSDDLDAERLYALTQEYAAKCAAIIVQREDPENPRDGSYERNLAREADCMADEFNAVLRARADLRLSELL